MSLLQDQKEFIRFWNVYNEKSYIDVLEEYIDYDPYYNAQYEANWKKNYALKMGKIRKVYFCGDCGQFTKTVGHHDDYSKPLEVRWLCQKCHVAWHKQNGRAAYILRGSSTHINDEPPGGHTLSISEIGCSSQDTLDTDKPLFVLQ